MKIRTGFVSNSSSSSFLIDVNKVSAKQLYKIQNHLEYGKLKNVGGYYSDAWRIDVGEKYIHGDTSMDNFDMREFLIFIGIDEDNIEWIS